MSKQLHQRKRSEQSLNDNWETPKELFDFLNDRYGLKCTLDVACTRDNCITANRLVMEDALKSEWVTGIHFDVWCNPPHSKNEAFVRKAYEQWRMNNINIMMILPANTVSSKYWHDCIEGIAEYHPIKGRIRFLRDGKPSEYPSRNAYVVVIWRKRI